MLIISKQTIKGNNMTEFLKSIDWLNILTIVASPIIAVWVGQRLQHQAKLREDNMQIFKALMTARIYGWTTESVHSLNIIDIVFADDKKVRDAWKNLYERYSSQNISDLDRDKTSKAEYKLIETIAISWGYKDKITWETIQTAYIPKGLINQITKNTQTQDEFSDAVTTMLSFMMQQQNTHIDPNLNVNKDSEENNNA